MKGLRKMKITRSDLRKKAFELIFQAGVVDAAEVIDIERVENPEYFKTPYIERVVRGTAEKQQELDEIIQKYLRSGWTLKRLSKVSYAVLRLAVYEMKYEDDVPGSVAINEAVEISKAYGDEKDPGFVNGILASVIREIEK